MAGSSGTPAGLIEFLQLPSCSSETPSNIACVTAITCKRPLCFCSFPLQPAACTGPSVTFHPASSDVCRSWKKDSTSFPRPALHSGPAQRSLLSRHHPHGVNGKGSQTVSSLDPWLLANIFSHFVHTWMGQRAPAGFPPQIHPVQSGKPAVLLETLSKTILRLSLLPSVLPQLGEPHRAVPPCVRPARAGYDFSVEHGGAESRQCSVEIRNGKV